MNRIAIFGGTFNPIHNGHLHIAQQFQKQLRAQRVLFIPTFVPPHKRAPDLAPAEDRLEMCRLACEGTPFEVSDLEIRRGGPSYTAPDVRTEVETALMQTIRREYPDAELCFLTGEDMFLTLETWYKPDVIYSLATICAAPRSTDGLEKLRAYAEKLARHGAKVILQNIDYLPVSSTMVREAVRQNRAIDALVPAEVARYIRENGLYH